MKVRENALALFLTQSFCHLALTHSTPRSEVDNNGPEMAPCIMRPMVFRTITLLTGVASLQASALDNAIVSSGLAAQTKVSLGITEASIALTNEIEDQLTRISYSNRAAVIMPANNQIHMPTVSRTQSITTELAMQGFAEALLLNLSWPGNTYILHTRTSTYPGGPLQRNRTRVHDWLGSLTNEEFKHLLRGYVPLSDSQSPLYNLELQVPIPAISAAFNAKTIFDRLVKADPMVRLVTLQGEVVAEFLLPRHDLGQQYLGWRPQAPTLGTGLSPMPLFDREDILGTKQNQPNPYYNSFIEEDRLLREGSGPVDFGEGRILTAIALAEVLSEQGLRMTFEMDSRIAHDPIFIKGAFAQDELIEALRIYFNPEPTEISFSQTPFSAGLPFEFKESIIQTLPDFLRSGLNTPIQGQNLLDFRGELFRGSLDGVSENSAIRVEVGVRVETLIRTTPRRAVVVDVWAD